MINSADELKGLSTEQIGAAANAATARGLTGKWVLTLQNTTNQPLLERLQDRALRERVYRASIDRGTAARPTTRPSSRRS